MVASHSDVDDDGDASYAGNDYAHEDDDNDGRDYDDDGIVGDDPQPAPRTLIAF